MAELYSPRRGLTKRERQVVAHLAEGLSLAEVAHRLFLAETTIKHHVMRARQAVGARNKVHLVAIAIRTGQLETP